MKKLTKSQQHQKQKLIDRMNHARGDLETAVEEYNTAMEEAWGKVEAARDQLQEAIDEADQFRDEIATLQDDYYCERSETWQEGDAGQAYCAWKDEWSNELDEVGELEKPNELELPDTEAIDALDGMPDEPG